MEEGITRKGFIAAAAAVGMSVISPATAMGEEQQAPESANMPTDSGSLASTNPLSALNVDTVEGADALAGSEWAEVAAAAPIDVVKSRNGIHTMNEPGYFTFSGWDPVHDLPTDSGFGYSRDGFFVMGREARFDVSEMYLNGARLSPMVPTILYDEPSIINKGNVTLSEPAENFKFLEVYFSCHDIEKGKDYVKVYNPQNGSCFYAGSGVPATDNILQFSTAKYTIDGRTLVRSKPFYVNFGADNSFGPFSHVAISAVIGYR